MFSTTAATRFRNAARGNTPRAVAIYWQWHDRRYSTRALRSANTRAGARTTDRTTRPNTRGRENPRLPEQSARASVPMLANVSIAPSTIHFRIDQSSSRSAGSRPARATSSRDQVRGRASRIAISSCVRSHSASTAQRSPPICLSRYGSRDAVSV